MAYRHGLRNTTLILLTGLLFVSTVIAAREDQTPIVVHGPYLQNPSEDGVTIIWFTNKKCASHVEYAFGENFRTYPQWGGPVHKARSINHGLVDADTMRHAIRIGGLNPGKPIRYRVVSREILQFKPYEVVYGGSVVSSIHEVRIPDPAAEILNFQVFQDVHGEQRHLDGLLKTMDWDRTELVFFNGDTLSYLEEESAVYDGFLDVAVKRFARKIPFVYVRGNHDTRGGLARNLEKYFPSRKGHYYYSLRWGPVCFLILDSGEDKPDEHPVYAGLTDFDNYRREQAEWLRSEMKTEAFRGARYKVAVFHIPPYGEGHGSQEIEKLWVPLLNEAGVDIALCGHLHEFSRRAPSSKQNGFPILVGPKGGTIRAEANPENMILTVSDETGQVLDRVTVTPNQASSDPAGHKEQQ